MTGDFLLCFFFISGLWPLQVICWHNWLCGSTIVRLMWDGMSFIGNVCCRFCIYSVAVVFFRNFRRQTIVGILQIFNIFIASYCT